MELDELDLDAVEAALALLEGDQHALGELSSPSEVLVDKEATVKQPKQKKRVRDPAIDVRRRERRRAERQELRDQVQSFETQLKALKQRGSSKEGEKNLGSLSTWEAQARRQQRRRRASEQLNDQLRTRLAEHFDLAAQVGTLLKNAQSRSSGQENVAASHPCGAAALLLLPSAKPYDPSDKTPALCPFTDALMKEARSMLHESSAMTSSILDCFMAIPGMGSVAEVSSSSRVRSASSESGPCVELLTSTPVPRNLDGTIEIIWKWLQSKRRSTVPGIRYTSTSRLVTQRGIEMKYQMRFPNDDFEDVVLHGATVLERHELVDCVALVFSTLSVQATGALRFREKGWVMINRSPLDPLHNSIVRCCYRVSADQVASGATGGLDHMPEFEHLRGFVQGKLKKRMSIRLKEMQCELLRETGRHELCAIIEM